MPLVTDITPRQNGSDGGDTPVFSIFMPTFNRLHTLPRALESIDAQTFRDFEVVIIDDGSTDNSREYIEAWAARSAFPVQYRWQSNQGRHVALNTALPLLRGELTVFLDSDDKLAPNALQILYDHWQAIPMEQRRQYTGIEGLTAFFDGRIAGGQFPQDILDSNNLEMRKKYKIKGDKKFAIRSDLLRLHPYPQFPNERHIRPSLLFKRLAHEYKTRYINQIIEYIEYQPDGLSSNRFCLRMRNPRGYRFFFQEEINQHSIYAGPLEQYDNYVNYIRYSLHCPLGLVIQIRDVPSVTLWLLALPRGFIKYVSDRLRMHRCQA